MDQRDQLETRVKVLSKGVAVNRKLDTYSAASGPPQWLTGSEAAGY
jgi:hypothetical protein